MTIRPPTIEERTEFQRILVAEQRRHERTGTRSQLIQQSDRRLQVTATIRLLGEDSEGELQRELESLDDQIAVLRHCRQEDLDIAAMLSGARERRARVVARLDQETFGVGFEMAQPFFGALPATLAPRTARRALALSAELHRRVLRVVDDVVDADLLRVERERTALGAAVFRCADQSHETRQRVIAFCHEIERLEECRDEATESLRFEAGARRSGRTGPLSDPSARTLEARAAIDSLRALHAAIAEVEAICKL